MTCGQMETNTFLEKIKSLSSKGVKKDRVVNKYRHQGTLSSNEEKLSKTRAHLVAAVSPNIEQAGQSCQAKEHLDREFYLPKDTGNVFIWKKVRKKKNQKSRPE